MILSIERKREHQSTIGPWRGKLSLINPDSRSRTQNRLARVRIPPAPGKLISRKVGDCDVILLIGWVPHMTISVTFPKGGFEAEVKIGDHVHLVLRAVHTAVGPVAGVYDAKAQRWAERQYAADIDDAKAAAAAAAGAIALAVLKHAGSKESFPTIDWQATG
jgi:hypothetical protein